MKFLIKPTDPENIESDCLIMFVHSDDKLSTIPLAGNIKDEVIQAAKREGFKGKKDELLEITTRGMISSYKLFIAGCGKKDVFDIHKLLNIVARAARKAKKINSAKIGIVVNSFWLEKFETALSIQTIVEAVSLSLYQFRVYKTDDKKEKKRDIDEVILQIHPSKIRNAESGLKIGEQVSKAVKYARDLVNEPAAVTTPKKLAETAEEISKIQNSKVNVKILEEEDIKKLGMNAFLGVSKGSYEKAKFIRLHYKPQKSREKVVLIGKGITFDTGGLSLKNVKGMKRMKMDMAGAAVVLGVFHALSDMSIHDEVVGLIPACENMPSGKALKPGDILKALNGKTIEVLNTDAEGRLTLADAVSYAVEKEKADEIIDIATLTGACMIALGQDVAGLWGNDEKILEKIKTSSAKTGEKVWHMPLEKQYRRLLDSQVADISNVQKGKYGGAITAALFISEFTCNKPWVHLDIAGPTFYEEDKPLLIGGGGSGFGVRLLLNYLISR